MYGDLFAMNTVGQSKEINKKLIIREEVTT